ncbi:DUF2065 domain-containing protein [Ferruginivarius sediminum]|jgi:uncharacterized protein YjeT (DUF2065 family)|uniref:DUF2065 domain-containing protein n=1 Tax=Ferruginivarius sediminum TaxID=2661937 RepID=A0A369TDT2_9PROT|nr:DUF2065 domain-containing protein [Ferruginivarius sediminum]RDD62535.1 DUF2065 domain-containing protein [Ferruginivarius sediminum]
MPDLALNDFLTAIALVLVFEGLSLAAFPGALHRALEQLRALPNEALRWGGLLMALLGLFFLYLLRG